jgi:hypothetical protein
MDIIDEIKQQLYTKNGKLNSAIFRRSWFKDSELFKNICTQTSFLPAAARLSERIYCVLHNIKTVQICPYCGKHVLCSAYHDKGYRPTCDNNKCKRLHNADWKSPSHKQRETHKNAINCFKTTYTNKRYKLINADIVKQYIRERIKVTDYGTKHSLTDIYQLHSNTDILCSILYYTKNIPINFKDLCWSERMFHIHTDLKQKPKCIICGKNETAYRNFKIGYSQCCSVKCTNILAPQKHIEYHLQNIIPLIKLQGFTCIDTNNYKGLSNSKIKLKCDKCGNILDKQLNNGGWQDIYCTGCHGGTGTSKGEQNLYEYIKSLYSGNILSRARPFQKPHKQKEIDIYLPDINFGIEYNGIFWHSYGITNGIGNNLHKENKLKHQIKADICDNLNTALFTIFESEWRNPNKQKIWKSYIKHKLGLNQKICADDCNIQIVNTEPKNIFLLQNDLDSIDDCDTNYGLYHNDELIFLISFFRVQDNKWMISRICNKLNFDIVDGITKILQYFIEQMHPDTINISVNKRYSLYNMQKYGFVDVFNTPPSCILLKGLTHYDVSDNTATEIEDMIKDGYRRIWDCGNTIYQLDQPK